VSERIRRLLVIVPTDPLRRQIAEKFMQLGVLKTFGCLSIEAAHPTVALLSRGPKTVDELDALVAESNVIVATMAVLSNMPEELRARLAELMTHLFVDEAHHIGARTWRELKLHFSQRTVLQFTATPFRNDGRRVDGKFIYVYPLRRAQPNLSRRGRRGAQTGRYGHRPIGDRRRRRPRIGCENPWVRIQTPKPWAAKSPANQVHGRFVGEIA
jgi:hypothetical protein